MDDTGHGAFYSGILQLKRALLQLGASTCGEQEATRHYQSGSQKSTATRYPVPGKSAKKMPSSYRNRRPEPSPFGLRVTRSGLIGPNKKPFTSILRDYYCAPKWRRGRLNRNTLKERDTVADSAVRSWGIDVVPPCVKRGMIVLSLCRLNVYICVCFLSFFLFPAPKRSHLFGRLRGGV